MADTKKTPFKKLDMNLLLEMACGTPENLDDWRKYQQEVLELPENADVPNYRGWERFTITLHCSVVTVIARKHPDNKGYQIRDYLVVEK